MNRKQGPRNAGMRPAVNDASHRHNAEKCVAEVMEVAA
jgi:hypothetical protein